MPIILMGLPIAGIFPCQISRRYHRIERKSVGIGLLSRERSYSDAQAIKFCMALCWLKLKKHEKQ
jgi:hypothetical protein